MAHSKTHPFSPWRGLAHRFLTGSVLLLGATLLMVLALAPGVAHAQDDPPGRVGRLVNLQGEVSWFDAEQGVWTPALLNRPLTSGDRLFTGLDGRVEVRVGSSVLRLAPNTQLDVLRLDDERMVWQLLRGTVALRVRTPEAASETELVTGEVRLRPETAGHFRWDRDGQITGAGSWLGSLRAQDAAGWLVESGERLTLWREWDGSGFAGLRRGFSRLPSDAFEQAVLAEAQSDDRRQAQRWVSPEMTGAEDLDRYGRWEQDLEHGALWYPTQVDADWAPYRQGQWTWVRPWGWTWVDDARWGFAPFHYGRWISWRGRWAWSPGAYVERPVYAPALVAWIGGADAHVQVSVSLPSARWLPLAPRDVYVPHYRHSPRYRERINEYRGPVPRDRRPDRYSREGQVLYGNQGVPGTVTVVPRDVLQRPEPAVPAPGRWSVDRERGRARDRTEPGGPTPRLGSVPPTPDRGSVAPAPRPSFPVERGGDGARIDRNTDSRNTDSRNTDSRNTDSRSNDMPAWRPGGRFGPPAPATPATPAAPAEPAAPVVTAVPPAARPAPVRPQPPISPAARAPTPQRPVAAPVAPPQPVPDRAARAPRENRAEAEPGRKQIPDQRARDRSGDRPRDAER